ncbi:MAG TPA: acetyl-CoA hydrolase/transferase C-terminal domain-containing protein [Baekduia sp.]
MRYASVADALAAHVAPGDRVLLGTAAGAATTLQRGLADQRERLAGLRLCGGMQLGGYDFLDPVREGRWAYDTWHVMPAVRDDVAAGRVGFHLARGGAIPRLVERLAPDVFLTTVSPPGPDGHVSFGASVSYALSALDTVPTVIAEVNPEMPFVLGRTSAPVERFAALVEAEHPLPHHAARTPADVDTRIAELVRELIPDEATVQVGIGGVPEALVGSWTADPPPGLRLHGMGIDAMVPLLEQLDRPGAFVGGELLGTQLLYRYAHRREAVQQFPIADILAVPRLAAIPRFVSINGAIEVDLTGQVNSEWAGGRQISGAGGGFDFLDGATLSEGGLSIVALRSTSLRGTASTIVRRLAPDTPVTVPRHAVQVVVTEHGTADLRGKTIAERAEALTAIAAPDFRDELLDDRPMTVEAR